MCSSMQQADSYYTPITYSRHSLDEPFETGAVTTVLKDLVNATNLKEIPEPKATHRGHKKWRACLSPRHQPPPKGVQPMLQSQSPFKTRLANSSKSHHYEIGDTVRIRKFIKGKSTFTPWLHGQVSRAILIPLDNSTQRCYIVGYVDPSTGQVKEKTFIPSCGEIEAPLKEELPPRQRTNLVVFAHIPSVPKGSEEAPPTFVPTPALLLPSTRQGSYHVRLLLSTTQNCEVDGIKTICPYDLRVAEGYRNTEVANEAKKLAFWYRCEEGMAGQGCLCNGTKSSFCKPPL